MKFIWAILRSFNYPHVSQSVLSFPIFSSVSPQKVPRRTKCPWVCRLIIHVYALTTSLLFPLSSFLNTASLYFLLSIRFVPPLQHFVPVLSHRPFLPAPRTAPTKYMPHKRHLSSANVCFIEPLPQLMLLACNVLLLRTPSKETCVSQGPYLPLKAHLYSRHEKPISPNLPGIMTVERCASEEPHMTVKSPKEQNGVCPLWSFEWHGVYLC